MMDSSRTHPLVSVIMAAHNVEKYIGEAIESIQAQTYPNWELIITNDGSPDNTAEIIARYAAQDARITVITHEKSQGQAIARNHAVEKARGEYLAILDSDDVSLPERLQVQVDFLEQHPGIAAVGSFVTMIDPEGKEIRKKTKPVPWLEIKFPLLLQTQFIHSTVTMRAEIFRTLGGYDTNYLHAEDYDLWSRMSDAGYQLENIPQFLVKFRVQPQSVTSIPASQKVQELHSLQINARNIKPYVVLPEKDLYRLMKLVNHRTLPFRDIFAALADYRKLVDAYCVKNTDPAEVAFVEITYQDKRRHTIRMKIKSLLGM
jgi:glycosyltransferase involved in cell wall biosynthesis